MIYSNVLYIVAKNLEISSFRSVMRFFGPWSNLMLEAQYLEVGQTLFSKSREYSATIKADSQLKMENYIGSIHKVAAKVLEKSAHNGWDFWYYEEEEGQLVCIDVLRNKYRNDHNLV